MEGYDASTYGERFADVYDDWYGDVSDVVGCTERVVSLWREGGSGPVLELGVGSGRLALPLVEQGVEVHGIDASPSMVERLRSKPRGDEVRVTLGDMAELQLDAPPADGFSVVFVAFNTFFNLATEASQQRCLERVAELLAPAGRFVLEGFVPDGAEGDGIDGALTPKRITADEVVLSVSQRDRAAQTVTGQHVHITESGIRLRPWHLRYATPEQLDEMAIAAGLELVSRDAGWCDERYTDHSGSHVSTYRRVRFGP